MISFGKLFGRPVRRKSILSAVVILGSLTLASTYNACSKVRIANLASTEKIQGLDANSVPALAINNGDTYTQSTDVGLSLSCAGATEMYVTNDSTCAGAGQWEPLSSSRPWVLNGNNQKVAVYAKYRGADQTESKCVEASIIHDDMEPVIAFDKEAKAVSNSSQTEILFHATDSGSGVKELYCVGPGQTSALPCAGAYAAANLADGSYLVQFSAMDNAGTVSTPVSRLFMIDRTPPTIAINSTPPKVSGSTSASFGFIGTDNLSGVAGYECLLDKQLSYSACDPGQAFMGLAQGPHTFSVRSVDLAGNESLPASYSWDIDSSVPTVSFTQTPLAVVNSVNAPFAFTGQDGLKAPLVKFECRLNSGTFAVCSSPLLASGVIEGSNTFGVRGTSLAGIVSSELTYKWLVDLTAPKISITQGPLALTNSKTASFTLSASDGGSGIESVTCYLDGSPGEDCKSLAKTYVNLKGDVPHSLQAKATDAAGNSTLSAPYVWVIDNTPPTLEINTTVAALGSQTSAAFTLVGSDAHGPISYQCRLDGDAGFTPCSATVSYSLLKDGTHNFSAQAIDGAGNLSDIKTYNWTVITTGPAITFTQVPNPTIVTTDKGILAYTIVDPASTVVSAVCKLDSTVIACSLVGETLTFPLLPAGPHSFTITATNVVGISSTNAYSFSVREPICTTTLTSTSILTKMIFVVDTSGSNENSPGCSLGPNCTDAGKKMRAGSIQTFYNSYGAQANFAWDFITFQGTTANALINSGNSSTPIFGNGASMQAAITAFKKVADANATPYMAGLNLATKAIATDPDLNSAKKPQYIVVFMSDGQPSDATSLNANILNQVKAIVDLSPGRVSFNAVYYGPVNQAASDLLKNMTVTGSGNFLNTNTNPTGLSFSISDLVSVPTTTCN